MDSDWRPVLDVTYLDDGTIDFNHPKTINAIAACGLPGPGTRTTNPYLRVSWADALGRKWVSVLNNPQYQPPKKKKT